MSLEQRAALILEAQRKGFGVVEDEGLWWVSVPAKPRVPASLQGSFKTSDRAWTGACCIASEYPLRKNTA